MSPKHKIILVARVPSFKKLQDHDSPYAHRLLPVVLALSDMRTPAVSPRHSGDASGPSMNHICVLVTIDDLDVCCPAAGAWDGLQTD